MSSHLSNLTFNELKQLQQDVSQELTRRERTARQDFLSQIRQLARDHGIDPSAVSLSETLNEPSRNKLRAPVKPKYRHPGNPSLTWTGRGKKPRWIEELTTQGTQLESLRISENS